MKKCQSIEKRLTVMLLTCTMLMTLLVSIPPTYFMYSEKQRWELEQVEKFSEIGLNLIRNQAKQLRSFVIDYANWDETYDYITSREARFENGSIDKNSLQQIGLAGLLIQDREGGYVFHSSTLKGTLEQDIWQPLLQPVIHEQHTGRRCGFLIAAGRLFIYVSEPITDTAKLNPSNGWLTMIREIDTNSLNEMSNHKGDAFELIVSPDSESVIHYPVQKPINSHVVSVYKNKQHIDATYSVSLSETQSLPVQLLHRFERKLSGVLTPLWWVLPQLLVILLVCGYLLRQLRRQITGPIIEISEHLKSQNHNNKRFEPLMVKRSDELGTLGCNINALFDKLFSQDKFSELLLDSIGEIIVTVNGQGHISFVNPAAAKWLNVSKEQLNELSLDYLLTNVARGGLSVSQWLHQLIVKKQRIEYHCRLRNVIQADKQYDAQIFGHPFKTSDVDTDGAVLIIRLAAETDESRHTNELEECVAHDSFYE